MRLSTRLTLAMVALAAATAAAVGFFTYRGIEATILPGEFARVLQHARERANELQASIRGARLDVLSFRGTNSVPGIIEARLTGGSDREWRGILGARLAAELASKPEYHEFRLIGVADGGREIVRVDRRGPSGAIRAVPDAELERRGDRSFFQATISLPLGDIHVAPIVLSRRNGAIEVPHVPVLRTATPVYGPDGRAHAILVVDLDMRATFDRLRASKHDDGQIYLVNADGDYLVHPDPSREFGFELGAPVRAQTDFPNLMAGIGAAEAALDVTRNAAGRRVGAALASLQLPGGPLLAVIETVPYAAIAAPALAIGRSTLVVGVIAVLLATALAVVLALSLTRPLEQMTAAVQGFAGDQPIAVPTAAAGEIGTLARAFGRMERRLNRLNRMYRTIIACNQCLIRVQDEATLARKICETMVEQGGYRMAWVGYALHDEERTIIPIASAGEDSGYVNSLRLTWADNERGSGPGARSIREGTVQVTRDMRTDPDYAYWRENAMKRGYASSISMPLKNAKGTFGFLGLYSGTPDVFHDEEVSLLTGVADDLAFGITILRGRAERLKAEEQLQQSQLALHDAQTELARVMRITAMGELTASIAHEINQPLAAVITNSDASLRWLAVDPPNLEEARQALKRSIRDANRASNVIKRVRAMITKDEPDYVALDLNDAIQEVLALTRSEQHRRHVTVATDLPAGLPPVRGDRVQLQQVMLNLILNAIEAMSTVSDRPPVLRISSKIGENGDVLVAVEDSGPGLDPATAEHVFDPFFTTKPGGMGMGLAISRSIVEAHGGRLWASRGSPHGTVFQFTVPRAADGMS